MIKELINRLLCSMFDSCIVTFGMIIERLCTLTAIAIAINIFGFAIVFENAMVYTWYNVVITGTLMAGTIVVVASVVAYLMYLLSELKDSIVLKLSSGYYDSTSSDKLWDKTVATCRKYRGD